MLSIGTQIIAIKLLDDYPFSNWFTFYKNLILSWFKPFGIALSMYISLNDFKYDLKNKKSYLSSFILVLLS